MDKTKSQITIRPAQVSDAPELAVLAPQLGYEVTPAEMKERLSCVLQNPEQAVFVAAMEDGRVVGFAEILTYQILVTVPTALLGGLVVDEAYRRRGIGGLLLERAESWAEEKGAQSMRINCGVKRLDAHSFYESKGYRNVWTQHVFRKDLGR